MTLFSADQWPVLVLSAAMIVAAIIDGWKLKVPNWLTFPLIFSGWILGLACNFGWLGEPSFHGGIGGSLAGTGLGFALLLPIYAIGGMGAGDVKMQMGFGSWIGAIYEMPRSNYIVLWAFCLAVVIGGVIALVMIMVRGQYRQNLENTRGIVGDLLTSKGIGDVADKAAKRKPTLHLLPYGIPLCIGFLGYLFFLNG
jgi:prepilin peptidase CpaA